MAITSPPVMPHADDDGTGCHVRTEPQVTGPLPAVLEAAYRFEPTATFFYEDLFARVEQPTSRLDAVLARLTRRSRAS